MPVAKPLSRRSSSSGLLPGGKPLSRRESRDRLFQSMSKIRELQPESLPIPPARFQPNKDYRSMEYELNKPLQTLVAGVTVFVFLPFFSLLIAASYWVRLVEALNTVPYFRDIVNAFRSALAFTSSPITNGPLLPKNPPFPETVEFTVIKSPWYIFRIVMCSILFLVRGGLTTKKVRVLDDTEFGDYIGHTMFSQYLQRSDTPDGETRYYLNLEEVRDLETWNGMFCSATETVFKKSQSGFLIPLSITMENGCTFTPQSAPSKWNLAKLFVMNGLVYVTIHGRHPTLHFPYDTVNVVTKRILPPNHPVSKLLYPHFRFSMVLNVNVLTESTSASFYHWWKPYYAVTCSEEEIFGKIMRRGYEKWSFRKFPKLNPEFPYDYSLLSYYQCIRRFVTNLMPFIPADDFIFRWGDEIAKLIPGFPNGSKLVSTEGREDLIDVLTMTIFSVGVHHNTDHYSFSHLDHRILPMRIRLPPPTYDSENDHFNEEDCMSRMDYFKQAHFQNLAVWPAPSAFPILTKDTRFMNVDYKFINPQMKEMQAAFKKDLRDTAAKLKSYFGEILPLSDIVSSTEF